MGGRGASLGKSEKENAYGSQYHSLLESDNIKFVTKNSRQAEDLLETMTRGRVYVTVGGEDLIRITFFDEENKRNKVIEKDKRTGEWHVHYGYEHTEYSENHRDPLSDKDKALLDRVKELWKNRSRIDGGTGILQV